MPSMPNTYPNLVQRVFGFFKPYMPVYLTYRGGAAAGGGGGEQGVTTPLKVSKKEKN